MKRGRFDLYVGWVQKNPAVLGGRPGMKGMKKKEGIYGKFKVE
jgi:uncharacterized protein (DUF433 family)